jgi:hypothetical protein
MGLGQLLNPFLFILGCIIAFIIIYFHNNVYMPYFLPELKDFRDNTNLILTNTKDNEDLYLIKGVMSLSNSEIYYNTKNKLSHNFLKFPVSTNNKGGAEFSYSFWINKKGSPYYKDRAIILKGIKPKLDDDVIIKEPLIKFGNNSNELVIEFNTIKKNNNKVVIKEIFDLISSNNLWYLVTIVFEDNKNYKNNDYPNGVNVSVYINDVLVNSGNVFENDALKLNNSPLYVLPKINTNNYTNLNGLVADIRYHNYALTQENIRTLFNKKYNKDQFKTALQIKNKSLFGTSDIGQINSLKSVLYN